MREAKKLNININKKKICFSRDMGKKTTYKELLKSQEHITHLVTQNVASLMDIIIIIFICHFKMQRITKLMSFYQIG